MPPPSADFAPIHRHDRVQQSDLHHHERTDFVRLMNLNTVSVVVGQIV
jgi:hypothetical protein